MQYQATIILTLQNQWTYQSKT